MFVSVTEDLLTNENLTYLNWWVLTYMCQPHYVPESTIGLVKDQLVSVYSCSQQHEGHGKDCKALLVMMSPISIMKLIPALLLGTQFLDMSV